MEGRGREVESRRLKAIAICLYLLLLGVYLLSYSGIFHNPDEVTAFAVTENMVKFGRFTAGQPATGRELTPLGKRGVDGGWYSDKGIGISLLAAPLYWFALKVPGFGLSQTVMLLNALLTAGSGTLLLLYTRRLGYSLDISVVVALLFGLCTMTWVYSKYFFSDTPAGFSLLAAAYFLLCFKDRASTFYAALAGGFLGLSVAIRGANLLAFPLFLAYLFCVGRLRGGPGGSRPWGVVWRSLLAFSLPFLAYCLLVALYNHVRFGDVLDFGYPDEFNTPLLMGLSAFLFSLDRSLFLYSPLLIASLVGVPIFLRKHSNEGMIALSLAILYLFLYSKWDVFWAGPVWGPRYLIQIVPFLMLFIAPLVEGLAGKRAFAFYLLSIFSAIIQLMGIGFNRFHYLQLHGQRYPLLFAPLSLDLVDLAWARAGEGGIDFDGVALSLTLAFVALSAGGLYFFLRRRMVERKELLVLGALAFILPFLLISSSLFRYYDDEWYGRRDDYHALIHCIQESGRPGDVLLLNIPPYLDFFKSDDFFRNYYKARIPYYNLLREEPPLQPEDIVFLERVATRYSRLWLMVERTPPADPDSIYERWLNEHAFLMDCSWFGSSARLCLYSLPEAISGGAVQYPLGANLDGKITLLRYGLNMRPAAGDAKPQVARSGDIMQVSLFWQARRRVEEDLTISLQVLDEDGFLRAQVDRSPVGGFSPTSSWGVGEVIDDRYGLLLPDGLPAGHYRLVVAIYDPQKMERVPVLDEAGSPVGDHILLRTIEVRS